MENRLSRLMNTKAGNALNASKVDFSSFPGMFKFPLIISPKLSGLILSEWVPDNMKMINDCLRDHGAILFRGFQIDTVDKFQSFIKVFDAPPLEYKQRSSPRFEVAKNIYHSTTYPRDQHINMHSENSYALNWARKIAFCCIQPADEQGETPIADNRLVLKYISDHVKDKFRESGVKYVRNISRGLGLSWEEVFQTDNRAAVESECRSSGMKFAWGQNDTLMLTWQNTAISEHPETHEEIWFNHAFFFNRYALSDDALLSFESNEELPFNTYYGDGAEITKAEIEEIRSAYDKSKVEFTWEKGDVLLMDNMICSHGRNPYKGDRQIIVSML